MAALTSRYEDDDVSHLPPGMKRVGYDTDTERYTFREGDDLWLGEPGSFYGGRMEWAGRAPDAGSAEVEEHDHDPDSSTEDSPAMSPSSSSHLNHEHPRNALSGPRKFQSQDYGNEWGVPVVSISETGAEPPDRPDEDSLSMKRRATKLKDVALSTADAFGVTRRWTRRRDTNSAGAQKGVPPFDQKRWEGMGLEVRPKRAK